MTRVAVTLVPAGDRSLVEEQVAFHRAAGADVALVGDTGLPVSTVDEHVRVVQAVGSDLRGALAQAAIEDEAEWVIDVRPGEFWWPRGESFQDVLAPMPPRYGVVQGLVRRFVPVSADGSAVTRNRATIRESLLVQPPPPGTPPATLLRPVFRAHPGLDIGDPAGGVGARQPLRAWYPLEVLTVPSAGEALDASAINRGLADGSLVVDERLRDALQALSAGRSPQFVVPDVVDDAAYAGECAAVGEVDLESLDVQIRELEARVAELEARFWPRVQRLAARVVRRAR